MSLASGTAKNQKLTGDRQIREQWMQADQGLPAACTMHTYQCSRQKQAASSASAGFCYAPADLVFQTAPGSRC